MKGFWIVSMWIVAVFVVVLVAVGIHDIAERGYVLTPDAPILGTCVTYDPDADRLTLTLADGRRLAIHYSIVDPDAVTPQGAPQPGDLYGAVTFQGEGERGVLHLYGDDPNGGTTTIYGEGEDGGTETDDSRELVLSDPTDFNLEWSMAPPVEIATWDGLGDLRVNVGKPDTYRVGNQCFKSVELVPREGFSRLIIQAIENGEVAETLYAAEVRVTAEREEK